MNVLQKIAAFLAVSFVRACQPLQSSAKRARCLFVQHILRCHQPKCPPNEVVADYGFFLQRLAVPYNAAMNPHDIRRWAENHRAAAAREAAEARKNPMTAD